MKTAHKKRCGKNIWRGFYCTLRSNINNEWKYFFKNQWYVTCAIFFNLQHTALSHRVYCSIWYFSHNKCRTETLRFIKKLYCVFWAVVISSPLPSLKWHEMRLRKDKVVSVCVLCVGVCMKIRINPLLKFWINRQTFTKFWYERYVVTNKVKGDFHNFV